MKYAVNWLKTHPEAKNRALESFGVTSNSLQDVLLKSPRRSLTLVKALKKAAASYDAPPRVVQGFDELVHRFASGVAALDGQGQFLKKTIAQLVGLREPRDIEMVLRGALPHAPCKSDHSLIQNLIKRANGKSTTDVRATTGQKMCCVVSCVLCGITPGTIEACAACCGLMSLLCD